MRTQWLHHHNAPELIIFFNGWGMDHHPVQHLQLDRDKDLLMIHDYRTLTMDRDLKAVCETYKNIRVLAWSMGVWAYTQLDVGNIDRVSCAIALNGTYQPIHAKYGISPQIYQATLDRFSQSGREKFLRRMCGSTPIYERLALVASQRSLHEQREELFAIQQIATTQTGINGHYDYAIISKQDKIIPTQHQINFWKSNGQYVFIDVPHFPFFVWNNWEEIFAYASEDR